jgi:hypothetical protein
MTKAKLYFRNEDSERCHPLSYFKDEMKDAGITEMMVFEAKPDKSKDHFWCDAAGDACASDDTTCGRNCEDYEPCNNKSGKCKSKTHCFRPDKMKLIKQKGEL